MCIYIYIYIYMYMQDAGVKMGSWITVVFEDAPRL